MADSRLSGHLAAYTPHYPKVHFAKEIKNNVHDSNHVMISHARCLKSRSGLLRVPCTVENPKKDMLRCIHYGDSRCIN